MYFLWSVLCYIIVNFYKTFVIKLCKKRLLRFKNNFDSMFNRLHEAPKNGFFSAPLKIYQDVNAKTGIWDPLANNTKTNITMVRLHFLNNPYTSLLICSTTTKPNFSNKLSACLKTKSSVQQTNERKDDEDKRVFSCRKSRVSTTTVIPSKWNATPVAVEQNLHAIFHGPTGPVFIILLSQALNMNYYLYYTPSFYTLTRISRTRYSEIF